ncbi:MAG: hypothetical protein JST87_04630 [Bacteroidetes bacterium]|nr:hypothetical protein [Bacteroidota bacterium]
MKKITAIFFFAAYLMSTTEVRQLLKLPIVFEHFAEHRLQNKNIGILEFLDIHYMHGSPIDNDYSHDMKLPFKTSDNPCSFIAASFIPMMESYEAPYPKEFSFENLKIPQQHFIISSYLSNIWQPPRQA